jgi:hypothetical protein
VVVHYLFMKYNIQFSHGIRASDLGGLASSYTLVVVFVVTFAFFVFIAIYCEFPSLMRSLWDPEKHCSSENTIHRGSPFSTSHCSPRETFHSNHTFHRDILFIALVLFIIKKYFEFVVFLFNLSTLEAFYCCSLPICSLL